MTSTRITGWKEYKEAVSASRKVIVFPFFKNHLESKAGIGLDIGCGDGDLTEYLAASTSAKIIGIDISCEHVRFASQRLTQDVHFAHGDIEKNSIPLLGMKFDFAFSNCCFSHISDQGIYSVLLDLHSCMNNDGELVFLVLCFSWAREMYADVQYVNSGIMALPRYGGRQLFRIPEWYKSALHKCGFELVFHKEITIPDSDELDDRYRAKKGCPLFSAFVARRVSKIPNLNLLRKAFEVAHENRKLEIGLFWQRSLFFWGFVAAALVGYGASFGRNTILTLVFSLFGFVCSIVWAAGNRGSKYWQEYWERKVSFYQHYVTGNIFFDSVPTSPRFYHNFSARRISVSKLTMALSDYMVFLWFILMTSALGKQLCPNPPEIILMYGPFFLVIVTLFYCLVFLKFSESKD